MSPDQDRTSIGNILLQMGMIDEEQLREAVEQQHGDPDTLLGRLLIAMGAISHDDLEAALSAQVGLRSRRRGGLAYAEAKIAQYCSQRVIEAACRVAAVGQMAVEQVRKVGR